MALSHAVRQIECPEKRLLGKKTDSTRRECARRPTSEKWYGIYGYWSILTAHMELAIIGAKV
jgi:hypothetical protein